MLICIDLSYYILRFIDYNMLIYVDNYTEIDIVPDHCQKTVLGKLNLFLLYALSSNSIIYLLNFFSSHLFMLLK